MVRAQRSWPSQEEKPGSDLHINVGLLHAGGI